MIKLKLCTVWENLTIPLYNCLIIYYIKTSCYLFVNTSVNHFYCVPTTYSLAFVYALCARISLHYILLTLY